MGDIGGVGHAGCFRQKTQAGAAFQQHAAKSQRRAAALGPIGLRSLRWGAPRPRRQWRRHRDAPASPGDCPRRTGDSPGWGARLGDEAAAECGHLAVQRQPRHMAADAEQRRLVCRDWVGRGSGRQILRRRTHRGDVQPGAAGSASAAKPALGPGGPHDRHPSRQAVRPPMPQGTAQPARSHRFTKLVQVPSRLLGPIGSASSAAKVGVSGAVGKQQGIETGRTTAQQTVAPPRLHAEGLERRPRSGDPSRSAGWRGSRDATSQALPARSAKAAVRSATHGPSYSNLASVSRRRNVHFLRAEGGGRRAIQPRLLRRAAIGGPHKLTRRAASAPRA